MRLEGKRAVVTGGSRGIGFEIAKIFIEEGAHVLAVSRSPDKLNWARTQLPSLAVLQADVSNASAVDQVATWVANEWGALDILVNNAGTWFGSQPDLTTAEDDTFMQTLQVNVVAAYLCTKRLLPFLFKSEDPRIVNVGSRSGLFTPNIQSAYGVSKAALHALTVATANELKGKVAVNGLSPGWVRTDMAPDGPRHPRWSAEGALYIVTRLPHITGKLFHGKQQRSWASRMPVND